MKNNEPIQVKKTFIKNSKDDEPKIVFEGIFISDADAIYSTFEGKIPFDKLFSDVLNYVTVTKGKTKKGENLTIQQSVLYTVFEEILSSLNVIKATNTPIKRTNSLLNESDCDYLGVLGKKVQFILNATFIYWRQLSKRLGGSKLPSKMDLSHDQGFPVHRRFNFLLENIYQQAMYKEHNSSNAFVLYLYR
ncbi:unnamed protein product [Cunninghamella blakesleeana]